jgi:hypothetical protein
MWLATSWRAVSLRLTAQTSIIQPVAIGIKITCINNTGTMMAYSMLTCGI